MDGRSRRGLALAVLALALRLPPGAAAQNASPSPPPASPTPPPAAGATPSPGPALGERKPGSSASPAARPTDVPKPAAVGKADAVSAEVAARRADRRARREEIERFLDGKGGEANVNKLLNRLPPDADRELFRKNLGRWRDLSADERDALRGQVDDRGERIKAEVDQTIKDSGLRLTPDQHEVYALRYVQERRKLERSLRDQMGAERARRLPGILDQLAKEFTPPPPAATPTPKPAAASAPPPATPAPSPGTPQQ